MDDKYEVLNQHLQKAFNRSATGKGKARHATDERWEEQKLVWIPKFLIDHPNGSAAPAYQAIKKTIEAGRIYKTIGKPEAVAEIYDAIVYLCATAHLIEGAEGKLAMPPMR
jgi:hypothetical protein